MGVADGGVYVTPVEEVENALIVDQLLDRVRQGDLKVLTCDYGEGIYYNFIDNDEEMVCGAFVEIDTEICLSSG